MSGEESDEIYECDVNSVIEYDEEFDNDVDFPNNWDEIEEIYVDQDLDDSDFYDELEEEIEIAKLEVDEE